MKPELLQRAKNGETEAQLTVAANYERGTGVKRDIDLAFSWYQEAAKTGSCAAMHHLSSQCRQGIFPGGVAAAEKWKNAADDHGASLVTIVLDEIDSKIPTSSYRDQKKKKKPGGREEKALTKKILVIDDDEIIRDLLQLILGQLGYQALLAESAKDALKKMNAHPDIRGVLFDYAMPEVNGLQLVALTKKMKILEGVPYIMVSNKADLEVVKKARSLGVAALLVKPFDKDKISTLLKTHVA